jgi:serine/threonine-protein kinase
VLPTQQSRPPKTLGRYEVGAKIGGGGMATVYVGRDVRPDGTEELVALKVIRDELANDEQFTAMFVDEAKILSRLSHPNVIQTLEYGVTGQHHFIAMELLNGRTIADVWDVLVGEGGRFDLGVAAWVCARVAEGLHSAHEVLDETGTPLNVIHRDVNPTNIFLTTTGDVKLIDFGLARARVRVSKSAEGIVKGKIPYLAPEQAHGLPIDRRIDIYALGTTLWEMVTMKRLFKRDTDIDTLRAIREAKVPDPREENPDFPEALWKVIERALRVSRDERYATAEELRTDLDAFARASGPHPQKIGALINELFPGGEARQAKWLRDAAGVRITDGTFVPPAPVPIASSSLLEENGVPSSSTIPHVVGRLPPPNPPPRRADSKRPEALEGGGGPPASEPASSGPASSAPTSAGDAPDRRPELTRKDSAPPARKSSRPPKKRADADDAGPTKKKRKKPRRGAALEASGAPAEERATLWKIVAAVVVVLILLAILASR